MSIRFTTNDSVERTANLPNLASTTAVWWARRVADQSDYSTMLGWEDGSDFAIVETDSDGDTLLFWSNNDSNLSYSPNVVLANDEWRFVAMTFDASKVYAGRTRLIGDTTFGTNAGSGATSAMTTPSILRIGNFFGTEDFNGEIAGVKIWTAQLTAAEIAAEALQLDPHRDEDLWAYFPMFAGSADRLKDYGPNGYDLSLTAGSTIADADQPPIPFGRRHYQIILPTAAGQTVTAVQATETDTAQAVTLAKRLAVAQATETDTAQAIAAARALGIGQAAETDSAGIIAARKGLSVAQAAETDTGQLILPARVHSIGQAVETDTAQTITPAEIEVLGQAVETDTAQTITAAKIIPVGLPTETDLAQPITIGATTVTAVQATETDLAQAITAARLVPAGQALETDTAQTITPAEIEAVGQALETDTAQPIGFAKQVTVGQAIETDEARAIAIQLAGAVVELDVMELVDSGVTPISGAFTPSAGSNRLLVVALGHEASTPRTHDAVTFGGEALTKVEDPGVGAVASVAVSLWYLDEAGIQAAVGTTITTTFSGAIVDGALYAGTFSAVNQTTPIDNSSSNSNASAHSLLGTTVNESSGNYVVSSGYVGTPISLDMNNVTEVPDSELQLSSSTIVVGRAASVATGTRTPEYQKVTPTTTNRGVIAAMVIGPASAITNVPVSQALETDTAQTISIAKVIATGQAIETDTALDVLPEQATTVNVAAETDAALPVVPARVVPVGLAIEFCQVFPITVKQPLEVFVPQARETDTALPILAIGGAPPTERDQGGGAGLDLPQMVAERIRQNQEALARDDDEVIEALIPVIAHTLLR